MSALIATLILSFASPVPALLKSAVPSANVEYVAPCAEYEARGEGCDFVQFDEPMVLTATTR